MQLKKDAAVEALIAQAAAWWVFLKDNLNFLSSAHKPLAKSTANYGEGDERATMGSCNAWDKFGAML